MVEKLQSEDDYIQIRQLTDSMRPLKYKLYTHEN